MQHIRNITLSFHRSLLHAALFALCVAEPTLLQDWCREYIVRNWPISGQKKKQTYFMKDTAGYQKVFGYAQRFKHQRSHKECGGNKRKNPTVFW